MSVAGPRGSDPVGTREPEAIDGAPAGAEAQEAGTAEQPSQRPEPGAAEHPRRDALGADMLESNLRAAAAEPRPQDVEVLPYEGPLQVENPERPTAKDKALVRELADASPEQLAARVRASRPGDVMKVKNLAEKVLVGEKREQFAKALAGAYDVLSRDPAKAQQAAAQARAAQDAQRVRRGEGRGFEGDPVQFAAAGKLGPSVEAQGPGRWKLAQAGLEFIEQGVEMFAHMPRLVAAAGFGAIGLAAVNMAKQISHANSPEARAQWVASHYDADYARAFDGYATLWERSQTVDQFVAELKDVKIDNAAQLHARAKLFSLVDPRQGGSEAKLAGFLDALSAERKAAADGNREGIVNRILRG